MASIHAASDDEALVALGLIAAFVVFLDRLSIPLEVLRLRRLAEGASWLASVLRPFGLGALAVVFLIAFLRRL